MSSTGRTAVQGALPLGNECVPTPRTGPLSGLDNWPVGSLPAVVIFGQPGYVVESVDKEALSKAVVEHFSHENRAEFIEAIRLYRQKFGWQQLIDQFEELAASCLTEN